MRHALIALRPTSTNAALSCPSPGGVAWEWMTPHAALEVLRPGDAALGRLDVLATLDGIDDGLWALGALAARGVFLLNDPAALLATHDKLLTARLLRRHGLAHPRTAHVRDGRAAPQTTRPFVLKPRFGSWGRDVYRCEDARSLAEVLQRVRDRNWFRRHGAIVQELVPPQGYDLRVLVAAGRVVGSVYRIAAANEWRTNVALGGVRRTVSEPPREAAALALAAAAATGATLVGVDLLPDGRGGWTVAELNGAVEFTHEYALWGDVFEETACLLAREAHERRILHAAFTATAA
jgi:ribosomal protein S6--L-glutamate ligase